MDRAESHIGRYTVGFRHYENYNNYVQKFPDATIEDYVDDMNSEISFDEYLLLSQKHFIYESTYNPMVVYEYGF